MSREVNQECTKNAPRVKTSIKIDVCILGAFLVLSWFGMIPGRSPGGTKNVTKNAPRMRQECKHP